MEQEQVWIKQALGGNQEAFMRLVETYQTPIYNLAYRMLGNSQEAEDAAQETFIRAYTRLTTYDPTRKFISWLLSIASHYCIDRLRRRRLNLVSLEELPPWQGVASDMLQPEERLIENQTRDAVQVLLESLPAHYRIPVILHYWYDLPYKEIAEMLELTESAVKSRLHRAREMLVQAMTQADEDRKRMIMSALQTTPGRRC
ncbi:MAG: sigma-70 family RNA polymerase sigma factor [Anaerolineae bacterium]|jgi:RNA polymerase sigma-70 factor (ECF subfamily)|nr:sigma-70 family RNA polymerase sigma factor [Anaerolineae bacterium]MDH7473593.1 sigma-70 family RNA polymerase sigma factor [Anaerolineae bacterium]